ncbi:hypothetical protein BDV98DRAFT_571540 [Pterulicium gracile]|uniref:Uncharacterized protein n=1 Tax=Pterulicium gracile TaxID=1884261 RepID=A0A5C3QBH4_9AGAR|nr:hypothetical protein BDV98DRAFT_571540 [Pterula gracilis]
MPGSSSYSMDLPWPTLEKSFRDGSSPDVRDFPAPAQERAPERRDAQRGSSRGFVGDFATGSASSAHSGEHPPTPLGKSEVETGVPGNFVVAPTRSTNTSTSKTTSLRRRKHVAKNGGLIYTRYPSTRQRTRQVRTNMLGAHERYTRARCSTAGAFLQLNTAHMPTTRIPTEIRSLVTA